MTAYYTLWYAILRPDLWDGMPGCAVMVPASTCWRETRGGYLAVRRAPPQCRPLFCDSGGFVFALKYGAYPFTCRQYIDWLAVMAPDYAAVMDYPVEIEIAADDAAVAGRQRGTIRNAVELMAHAGGWVWVPVLQGRTVAQYLQHVEMYRDAGLLRDYMAIGSLCRRTSVLEIGAIIQALTDALPGTRFHLFGVKQSIFKRATALPESVESADTAAWNGLFGKDRHRARQEMQRDGITQAEYQVWRALGRYQDNVAAAFALPKQLAMW